MENKLKGAFDSMTMPESCCEKIEDMLCKPNREKMYAAEPVPPARFGWAKGIAAAAAVLAVLLLASGIHARPDSTLSTGESTEETEATIDKRDEILDENDDILVDMERDLDELKRELEDAQKEYETITDEALDYDHYYTVDEEGRAFCRYEHVAEANAASAPAWIQDEDGRLYFVGNGEKIDITDEISLETPYIYTYTDDAGIKWALIAGRTTHGPYVDIGNSVGWFTFHWDDSMQRWFGDSGTNWSNWMHCEWPWLTLAQETLDALPEEESGIIQIHSENSDGKLVDLGEKLEPGYAATLANIKNGLRYPVGSIHYSYSGWGNELVSSVLYDTSMHTPWTEIVDGRVIFTLDKTIDITDQFSEEEPFIYIYTDIFYITHYIAIGGTAENPGYLEMTKLCWETEMGEGDLGGFGSNTWNYETDSPYGWEQRAKELFEPYGVYWAS